MGEVLHPFVKWGQNNFYVFVKIDLQDIQKDPKLELHDDCLLFEGLGVGMNGKNKYRCNIHFYLDIDSERSAYSISGRYIQFKLAKSSEGQTWPRLSQDNVKPAWLKIDFDHFTFEDSESEVEAMSPEEQSKKEMEDFLKEMREKNPNYPVDFKLVYLMIYNLFQFVGCSFIMGKLLFFFIKDGSDTRFMAFQLVGEHMATIVLTSVLEVVHPLLGWVKTDWSLAAMQVFGRNLILFGLLFAEPNLHKLQVIWYLFLAWTGIELVRYPFYMMQTLQKELYVLTWLRYTLWIPLYPLGFISEGVIMIFALPYFEQSLKFCLSLPNKYNFAFYFPWFLKLYMVLFFAGMYILMTRMYQQRRKKIGVKKPKRKTKIN